MGWLSANVGRRGIRSDVEYERPRRMGCEKRHPLDASSFSAERKMRWHRCQRQPNTNMKKHSDAGSGCSGTTCSSFWHPAEKCSITEDGKCDALREVTRSVAGHIRKPYSAGEIAAIIESGDYSSEMMMQHLLILVTNAKELAPPLRESAETESKS